MSARSHWVLASVAATLMPIGSAFALPSPVSEVSSVEFTGHVSEYVRRATYLRDAEPTTPIRLYVPFKNQHPKEFEALLKDLSNPSSPRYTKWLTPQEYRDWFGPTVDQYESVRKFLAAHGWKLAPADPLRKGVNALGSADLAEKTFRVRLKRYRLNDKEFFGNDKNPWVPASLVPVIGGVFGLENYPIAHHDACVLGNGSPSGCYSPQEIAKVYCFDTLWSASTPIDGTGQTIGILIFSDADWSASWVAPFFNNYSMPVPSVTRIVLSGTTPATGLGGELALDVDASCSVAKGRSAVRIYTSDNAFADILQSFTNAVSDNVCKTISASIWLCGGGSTYETNFDSEAATAASQGITFIVSSGDCGYTGPQMPAEFPNSLTIGGTAVFKDSATGAWCDEQAWSDGEGKSGAGISNFARPSWQAGPGVPAGSNRVYPDVAGPAGTNSGGFPFGVYQGSWYCYAGTSWAAPFWNGVVAMINQARANVGLGTVNTTILHQQFYQWLQTPPSPQAFHDITTGGSNAGPVTCGSGACSASACTYCGNPAGGGGPGVGWDWPTGIGSPLVCNLVALLAPVGSPTATVTQTTTSTTTATVTRTATPTATGTVTASRTASQTATTSRTVTSTRSATPSGSATVTSSSTPLPTNTNTSQPTSTASSTATPVPPSATGTITLTATVSNTVPPGSTSTQTFTPAPTNTNTPIQTNTSSPTYTSMPVPTNTNTPFPTNTNTQAPTITNTPAPTNTNTPIPTNTFTRTLTPTATATMSFTVTATLTRTNTPIVVASQTATPLAAGKIVPVSNPISLAPGAQETFVNVPPGTAFRIYSVSGELIRTLPSATNGMASWDLANSAGSQVSPGIYYWVAVYPGGRQEGVVLVTP